MSDLNEDQARSTLSILPDEPVDITVINFFPAFTPPGSGGEMRYYHICSRLAKHGFRVHMVNPTHPFVEPETVQHGPRCTEYRVPQTMKHHRLYQFMRKFMRQGECSSNVVSLITPWHREFVQKAREHIARSKIVIFDYPLPTRPFLKGMKHPLLIVHNTYNVEGLMQQKTLRGHQGRLLAAHTAHLQKSLCRKAHVVFACSHEDADTMTRLYKLDPTKIYIVPNGVEADRYQQVDQDDHAGISEARQGFGLQPESPVALFTGSQHYPNVEAARFLIQRVAPQCPDTQFAIAGSVCESLDAKAPENVRVIGRFEESRKAELFRAATLAVNPMFSGSGTNLKMLEFFAAGLPVLATPFGARGFHGPGDENWMRTADEEGFARAVEEICGDLELRKSLGKTARKVVAKKWNWDQIGLDAARVLHQKTHRRVLVLNDYQITPAIFGGKVRVMNHYKMVARHNHVTILTLTRLKTHRRKTLAPNLEELNIPEGWLKTFTNKTMFALLGKSSNDISAYLTSRWLREFRRALDREALFADVLVLSHPYMVKSVGKRHKKPVIYESHNVEYHLKKSLFTKGPLARWALRKVYQCEKAAVARADLIAVCSQENADSFRKLYPREVFESDGEDKPVLIVPNGVNCRAHWYSCGWRNGLAGKSLPEEPPALHFAEMKRQAGLGRETVAVFLGSGHPPNQQAAQYIIDTLAPENPEILFLILGSVCWAVHGRILPRNVLMLYQCSETMKNRFLGIADIAVNPLQTGSGVSLKTMDCLAAGTAMLSTEVGARGVDIVEGREGYIRSLDQFSETLQQMQSDPAGLRKMGENGRKLAWEKYDWRITSKGFIEALDQLRQTSK
ncbi:MAG: glycosyltransferase family 4 protein [Candidatus Sumerlaeia bacterium]